MMFKDITSSFVPLINLYTQTDNVGGRPTEENPENDNTVASQERESNELNEG